jgi:transposase
MPHAPAQHPQPLLRGFRVHTLICRGSGLALFFLLSPANFHDAPFAKRLLEGAVRLYQIRPRVVQMSAAYWGLRLIAWIHAVLGAIAVIPWNPKNQKNRSCLPPTWTREELGKRSSIERFFGRVFLFFHQASDLPCVGGLRSHRRLALTFAASVLVGLAAQQASRPDLIRSPKRVLAHRMARIRSCETPSVCFKKGAEKNVLLAFTESCLIENASSSLRKSAIIDEKRWRGCRDVLVISPQNRKLSVDPQGQRLSGYRGHSHKTRSRPLILWEVITHHTA